MRVRIRAILAALALTAATLLGASAPGASAETPTPTDAATSTEPTASTSSSSSASASAAATTPTPFVISGVDLHDAVIKKFGSTYYMYGSMYACGYEWYVSGTPWCGFGVSTAPSPRGPWTKPRALFDPNSQDPWAKTSWQTTCGGTGQGCFNPRMIQRSGWGPDDGVFVLWFNSPRHYSDTKANAYNVMGCAGPAGPCGPGAQPNGSYNKPSLDICAGNGDFGIIDAGTPGARPAIVCTRPGSNQISLQELNWWGSGGTTGKGVTSVVTDTVEGPGGWWDAEHNTYVITYSDQGCGYCAGTPAGYATAPDLYGTWTVPGNVGWGAPVFGRRDFSPGSCGGQPRTVTVLDGQPWQIIDLWRGTRNETQANTLVAPLSYSPTTGTPGDGQPWIPPVSMPCS